MAAHRRNSKFSPDDNEETKQAGKNVRILVCVPKVRDARNLTELPALRCKFTSDLIGAYSTAYPSVTELQDRMKLPGGTNQRRELGWRENGFSLG
jgi:hypothetical protein